MFGRSGGPHPHDPEHLTYVEALHAVLAGAPYPVLDDVDIGHRPPQLTLINGPFAQVVFEAGGGRVVQTRHAPGSS